jgi:hypothetical protein
MGNTLVVPARCRSKLAISALALLAGAALPFSSTHADVDAGARFDASAGHIPPDPTPMLERRQWIFDLRYERGEIYLLGVHRVELPAPQQTPRAMGRFALELFEGPTLIERVRFDFPLLGDAAPHDAGFSTPPSFGAKLTTRIGVMFPATSRGTKLELWDRATDRRWALPWPPTDTRLAPHDAGAEDAAGGEAGAVPLGVRRR